VGLPVETRSGGQGALGDVVRRHGPTQLGVPEGVAALTSADVEGPTGVRLLISSTRGRAYRARVLAVDHVIVVVHDLDATARHYEERMGLGSVAGGRHPGHGTGNRIVPLGSSYIELMAVIDPGEATASPLGSWVQRHLVEVGEAPAALCLRTDDIEATARRTECEPLLMSRTRPDGVELAWHLVALDAAVTEGLPFFIQWHVDDGDHPGRSLVEHRCPAVGIDWVELGGDRDRLESWLGHHELPLRHVDGAPGPHRVAVAIANRDPIVIGGGKTNASA
jgi:Glyoxalase-like domain